ncbi:YfcL family protein [Glaciecola sp. 1036]|uniref:YfcL family protein n=1 Tax=Alteromonadaceae TaxID=72275 RepID=UPI003D0515DC
MILSAEFEDYLSNKETFLDSFIEHGSDQELFAASYLHGHLSLIAARVFGEYTNNTTEAEFNQATSKFLSELQLSIQQAIDEKELTAEDAADVQKMYQRLLTA